MKITDTTDLCVCNFFLLSSVLSTMLALRFFSHSFVCFSSSIIFKKTYFFRCFTIIICLTWWLLLFFSRHCRRHRHHHRHIIDYICRWVCVNIMCIENKRISFTHLRNDEKTRVKESSWGERLHFRMSLECRIYPSISSAQAHWTLKCISHRFAVWQIKKISCINFASHSVFPKFDI